MIRKNFARRTLHDVRAASVVANARPAWAAGFRAAIATVAPLIVDPLFHTGGGAWMSLAGLNGAIIDRGGPYRLRAATMSALAVGGAAAALVGTLVSGHLWLSVVVTFAIAVVCGLLRAWVEVGVGFGVTLLVTYAVALAIPAPSAAAALLRALYLLIGGLWALVLAMAVWPLRPYKPVRARVAQCYVAIANYLADVASAGGEEDARSTGHDVWAFKERRAAMRAALESARTALAVSRRGRGSETGRGERLLVLHELADQLVAHIVALLELADEAPPSAAAARPVMIETLGRVADTARAIAEAIEAERGATRPAVRWNGNAVRQVLPDARHAAHATHATHASSAEGERQQDEQMAMLLDRMAEYAETAGAVVATLNSGDPEPDIEEPVAVNAPQPLPPRIFSFSAIVRPESMVLQHALRVATVTAVAVFLTQILHLNHGYWVTLTVVVILQPFSGATRQKALQRVAGTVLGGIVAAVLSSLFQHSIAILVLIGLFTAACVALLPLNYGAYAVFGTPAFVLLAEASAGDWHLAGLRILNTLLGGALALLGSGFLWPGTEWTRLPEHLATAIRANLDYLEVTLDMLGRGERGDANLGVLRDARRNIAIAASNAEESFQRLLGETSDPPERLEPIMAFLVGTRRFASSIAALAIAGVSDGGARREALAPFERAAREVLEDLADAITHGRRPAPFPPIGTVRPPGESVPPLVRARVTRLARQLKLLHDAVERWSVSLDDATSAPPVPVPTAARTVS